MNDFNLINASVDWCEGPRLDLNDDRYPVYAVNFNQKIKNNWCSIHENYNFKPFCYFKSNFKFRIQWKIKIWGFDENIVQVFENTYDEKNKNICLQFNGDIYKSHKLWLEKSIKLSKQCNFNLYVISKFSDRLKKDFITSRFKSYNLIEDLNSFKISENIYAKYTIDRKEILTKTEDWWQTGKIFVNHSRPAISWDHPEDWIGMSDEQIYNNIMDI